MEKKFLYTFFLSALIAGIFSGRLFYILKQPSDIGRQQNVPTKVYDVNNKLIAEFFVEYKNILPLSYFPEHLRKAFILSEDDNFYYHSGIDPTGILRAMVVNMLSVGVRMGGSTITQQLAKIIYIRKMHGKRKRNLITKLRELFIAFQLERNYTKDKILEMYLNQIYLGHGTYGVSSASSFYFHKNVTEINPAESALLASLTTAPEYFSPIKFPLRAKRRQYEVLKKLAYDGEIKYTQVNTLLNNFWNAFDYKSLPPNYNIFGVRKDKAPWFSNYILQKLLDLYGKEEVFGGGLRVYTTLDLDYQKYAKKALLEGLKKQDKVSKPTVFQMKLDTRIKDSAWLFSKLFSLPPYRVNEINKRTDIYDELKVGLADSLGIFSYITGNVNMSKAFEYYLHQMLLPSDIIKVEGALISIDPRNGYIKAMVGGRHFSSRNSFNRAMYAYRQAGSSFKPFVYGAAFNTRKFTAATALRDSPEVTLKSTGEIWMPQNYEQSYSGLIRLRDALRLSINIISIRLAELIGIDTVIDFAARLLKINDWEKKRRLPEDFTIALGSADVTPYEMARAYAIIANHGKDVVPIAIRYVMDSHGNIIYNPESKVKSDLRDRKELGWDEIIKPEIAFLLTDLLKDVVDRGTATVGIRQLAGFKYEAAGKTGTTNRYKDAWFVGFTPALSTAIWVGFDNRTFSLGSGQAGGIVAAPIWGNYMKMVQHKNIPFKQYVKLNYVKVCAYSGMLPGPNCKKIITEKFIPGTEPKSICTECINRKNEDIEEILKEKIPEDWHKKEIEEIKDDDLLK